MISFLTGNSFICPSKVTALAARGMNSKNQFSMRSINQVGVKNFFTTHFYEIAYETSSDRRNYEIVLIMDRGIGSAKGAGGGGRFSESSFGFSSYALIAHRVIPRRHGKPVMRFNKK